MPKTILIHGPSGCGKDTQVDMLLERGGFEKIGTGEMFRKLIEQNHPRSEEISSLINSGNLVPSDFAYELLDEWMDNYEQSNHWVFVSVVRAVDQIELLDKLLGKYGRELDAFVHFHLSSENAIGRMSQRKVCSLCGENYHSKFKPEQRKGACDKDNAKLVLRKDDEPESISRRLETYYKAINPILDEYRKRNLLVEIDAAPHIEEVHKMLLEKLKL